MKKLFCLVILVCAVNSFSQPPRKFHTSFGGYGHDIGYSILQTYNGQYAIAGSTSSFGNGNTDVYLAYVDSMGWLRWEKSYGGFNNDIGKSIIQLSDSGFVIAGYTNSFGNGGYDMYIVRVDKNGNLIWQKTIGGMDWDFGNCVIESSDGSLVICGNTYSYGYGKSDGYIVKLDLNGNFLWQKTYGGSEDEDFKSVIETYNNQLAIAGSTKSYGDLNGDAWLVKTDLSGNLVLQVKYGLAKQDFWNDLAERPINNHLMMAGAFDRDLSDSTYAQIMEVDENGTYLYEAHWSYHNLIDGQFSAIAFLKNDPFFGLVRKQFNSTQNRKLEPMIMITAPIFDIPGGVTPYGSPEDDELFDIAKTRDKGFICVGYTKGFGANLSDVYIVKIDSDYFSIAGGQSIVGIKEPKAYPEKFSVYPTLTNGKINILCEKTDKEINIRLSDCLGRLLYEGRTKESQTTLDLELYKEGVYFISLSENGLSRTFKIIKSN